MSKQSQRASFCQPVELRVLMPPAAEARKTFVSCAAFLVPSGSRYRKRVSKSNGLFSAQFVPVRAKNTGCSSAAAGDSGLRAHELKDIMANMLAEFMRLGQQQQQQALQRTGAALMVEHVSYHPAGAPRPILNDVTLTLPGNSLGVVFGRSGSGKTSLLAVLSGLLQQNSGCINILGHSRLAPHLSSGVAAEAGAGLSREQRLARAGLVFQFPERHFLGENVAQEIALTWPRTGGEALMLEMVAAQVLQGVGLAHIPLTTPLNQLSDGYKRRVALAVQLCRQPDILLLDEPLAGLDWQARADVAQLLGQLKQQCTILVVSHDLKEISHLVDHAWRMLPGGHLQPSDWPVVA